MSYDKVLYKAILDGVEQWDKDRRYVDPTMGTTKEDRIRLADKIYVNIQNKGC